MDATKFCKSLRGKESEVSQGLDTLTFMMSLATDFNESLINGDSQEVRDSRQKNCEGIASLRANCIIQTVTSLHVLNRADFCTGKRLDSIFARVHL